MIIIMERLVKFISRQVEVIVVWQKTLVGLVELVVRFRNSYQLLKLTQVKHAWQKISRV